MYPIIKKWLPGLPKLAYRKGKAEGVLGHSTATPEADAEREYQYFLKNWKKREAFVHYFVDWTTILETADPTFKCWGAGPTANQRFIQIELCETNDHVKFQESYKRYLWLIAKIIVDFKFDPDHKKGLWTHFDATHTFYDTNHVDPFLYLEKWGIGINQFLDDVEETIKDYRNPKIEVSKVEQKPSAWAEKSWEKAKELGLLDGTRPKDNVTREELAAVLVRLNAKLQK